MSCERRKQARFEQWAQGADHTTNKQRERKMHTEIYPSQELKKYCKLVTVFDEELKELAADMLEHMSACGGVGLAAPQIGLDIRLIVVDVKKNNVPDPRVMINPVITKRSNATIKFLEGCLSMPGVVKPVDRSAVITVSYQNADGERFEEELTGRLAACVQHEIDHLDGIMLIDRLGKTGRALALRQYARDMKRWRRASRRLER